MKLLKYFFILLLCLWFTACQHGPQKRLVSLSLYNGGRSVKFTGLEQLVINEIARDTNREVWQSLIPVYKMPADTDLKGYQPLQPGKYVIKQNSIIFTPDTPFVKGKTYFVRSYQLGQGTSFADYLQGRAQLGKLKFIDLVFKP
ncbi:hypothetical protein CKK33_04615 [Mucilaginibacter sp. MD40]|uniref:hypothetical protein n=1 Tax=Mucilaginibacter sp. MD40 TaxID=2029590 RepID=UPI000BD08480|nr:hypothetical protein [Mucilaginibacter sp. MD40]PAW92814.1 hypothetical protein CKK33_04615 [Mucilaginibacter sp. MD40]